MGLFAFASKFKERQHFKKENMKEITIDTNNVAYCGLYCGACGKFLKDKCPGCHENEKASWCKVRICCMENGYATCADCRDFPNPDDCRMYNNFMAKLFSLIFRSDRTACLTCIRESGLQAFAERMARERRMSMKR